MSFNFNYNYPQLAREAGFRVRQYKDGPLDWRLLGSFEIERLLRDQNLEDIDKILGHLSEAPLATALLETNILDSGIAKYFIVSQFAVQYLMFCRNFLDETIQELRESHTESQVEIITLKKSLTEANNEILQLHKKVTQMEAIHEVIYPCHLCTKNFANNEALNIHIGRKHNGNPRTLHEHKNETPVSTQKDLTLINTIKLELEIKQLKERLNNAEKEIKQRNQTPESSKEKNSYEANVTYQPVMTTMRHVAIQSNLSEEKEQNESVEEEKNINHLTKNQNDCQLVKLQEKLYDFEEWRGTQMAKNEDSIAEINKKLTDISEALERNATRPSSSIAVDQEEQQNLLERRLSMENLERVLIDKVDKINKINTEKLKEIVQNIESNYCEKLLQLEHEMKKNSEEREKSTLKYVTKQEINIEEVGNKMKHQRDIIENKHTEINDEIVQIVKSGDVNESEEDGTYSIKLIDKRVEEVDIDGKLDVENSNINETFIEDQQNMNKTPLNPTLFKDNLNDLTDISESLSKNEVNRIMPIQIEKKTDKSTTKPDLKIKAKKIEYKEKSGKISKMPIAHKYTRRDAKMLASKRLNKYGYDIKMKAISSGSLKQVNLELYETRLSLKEKYSNFFATRNKIKKFVDKLCTTKLSDKAERVLASTPTLQPIKMHRNFQKLKGADENGELDKIADKSNTKISVVVVDKTKDDFKTRLERLLTSPVQKPANFDIARTSETDSNMKNTVTAQIHKPIPRKRVMFNTLVNKPDLNQKDRNTVGIHSDNF